MNTVSTDQYVQWRANTPEIQLGNKACDAICYAPFTSILFDPKGYVRTCCQSMTHSIGNITQQTLKEIWNGESNRNMQDLMKLNYLPEGCLTCQSDIDKGSFEQTFARLFDIFPVPVEQPQWPQNMWFLMSNACNLECVQCYGELSSSIRKNRDKLPPLKRVYTDDFFEELREFLPHLRLALFLGGEAFLSRESFRIWDMMIEDGLTTESLIVTNGTQFNKRVVQVLSSLPCKVSISLDGATKETVESIRLNARFDEIIANIEKIQQYSSVELSFCLMPQNYHEFGDFLILAERMGCDASANTVYQPAEYSLPALPPEELARVVAQWEAQDVEMRQSLDRHRNLWEQELARLQGWVKHPESPPGPLYLTAISSRMDSASGPARALSATLPQTGESSTPTDLHTAEETLLQWCGNGCVDKALLDADDIISGTQGTFGGLESQDVNNRALSIVLMLLRERYGEDVNILNEQWTETAMDRTMEFTDLKGQHTYLRWIVLFSPHAASGQRTFLLAVGVDNQKMITRPKNTHLELALQAKEANLASIELGKFARHRPEQTPAASQAGATPNQAESAGECSNSSSGGSSRADDLITTDARAELEQALEEARHQLEEEHWLEATQALGRLCTTYEQDPEPYFLLGRATAALGDWERSATAYAGAIKLGAVTHDTWAGLGEALTHCGRLDSAQKAYSAAIALEPPQAETHAGFASTLVRSNQLEPALAQFERAAELGLKNNDAERGRELYELGRLDEAIAALRQAVTPGEESAESNTTSN